MDRADGQHTSNGVSGGTASFRRLSSSSVSIAPAPDHPRRQPWTGVSGAVVLFLVVLLAFPVTALSLWTGMQTDMPLAYQGLIPLLAFGTAVAHAWRRPTYVWRDSVTELAAALPFLLGALGLMYAGTRIGSIYFWYNRTDLLALALFGIGAAIVLFGVGAVTRSWFAVLFLILVWPAPYQNHLSAAIIRITDATVLALDAVLRGFDWSGVSPAGDAVYRVRGPDGVEQLVGVDSPCAGATGMFGFLIVAIPAMYLTVGTWRRKALWVAAGLFLLWALNVGRIFALFAMATTSGVGSELFWWTHAALGIVLFTVAMFVMLLLGVRCAFRFERADRLAVPPTMLRVRRRAATPALVLVTMAVALLLGSLNRDLKDAVGLSTQLADGTPIASFATALPAVDGVEPRYINQYDWSRQFFGRDSVYRRYAYRLDGRSVWIDSVVTSDRERLDLFNLQGCYSFHGYEMTAVATVDVGYGIVGQQIQFIPADSAGRWVALSWTWPVTAGGRGAHERVTVLQYIEGDDVSGTVASQRESLSALERLLGIGNGRVAVGPASEEVLWVSGAIVRSQLVPNTASR